MREHLDLADYRQRVAAMYLAEPVSGVDGWRAFRAARDELFRSHPQSALDEPDRGTFTALPYFDHDERFRVRTRPVAVDAGPEVSIDTGGEDGVLRYRRIAHLPTPYGRLTLFWLTGYGGGLFLPFRDTTAPARTYGGGRYLVDTVKGTFGRGLVPDGDELVLDFNYAYNPSCAYNSRYACPLAPRENWLTAPIRAGELNFRG
ncbi:MAG TPA: DUF1684 domain-containing protein [Rugosimonospora sp.]|nr:DUF1684 domain-containing protein [Rugosimonospora sp.]